MKVVKNQKSNYKCLQLKKSKLQKISQLQERQRPQFSKVFQTFEPLVKRKLITNFSPS
jgi:hypothetical protein